MSLLSQVRTSADQLPSRVFLYAREKWGKSSLLAQAPNAIFFMTRGETGLVELIASGRVPPTAHFPYDETRPPSWATLRQAVKELVAEEHDYRRLVIDTANGAEILCQEHVRQTQFGGSVQKFNSYGKGWDACRVEWLALLQDLDLLRAKRKVGVFLLAHTRVKKFDDPTTEESYDKYQPACQDKLWELTHKWADIICFGHFIAQTYETDGGRVKARPELARTLCFDQTPMWEAGNRYGMSFRLDMGGGPQRAWNAFAKAVAAAKQAATTAPTGDKPAAPEPAPAAAQQPPVRVREPGGDEPEDAAPEPAPEAPAPAKLPAEKVERLVRMVAAAKTTWPKAREKWAENLAVGGRAVPEKINDLDHVQAEALLALLGVEVAKLTAPAGKGGAA